MTESSNRREAAGTQPDGGGRRTGQTSAVSLQDEPFPFEPQPGVTHRVSRASTGGGDGVVDEVRESEETPGRAGGSGAARRGRSRVRAAKRAKGRTPTNPGMPIKPISVSLPASVALRWKQAAKRASLTQADFLLDSVSKQRDALPDLVHELRRAARPSVATPPGGLFVQVERAGGTDPYVAVSLRLRAANVDILDGLAHEAFAESRSQLVLAVLTRVLADLDEAQERGRTGAEAVG